jgi:hypothetical protein|tara:strand:- start:5450 stop:5686 length:237 start_codon:yes stop_codon:yes gene_type:complete
VIGFCVFNVKKETMVNDNRERGFYKVRYGKRWIAAYWCGELWGLPDEMKPGEEGWEAVLDQKPDEVGEFIPMPLTMSS